ncbi:MAG TPA: hypothetical protein VJ826_11710 [Candidatus Polarisedimenticolaceae bacterium]|nr:hypothetical protein [Candidatus Polarisedimenticolaceae bacterium]
MSRFVAVGVAIALVLCGVIVGALGTYLILEGRGHREARWGPPPPPHPPGPPPGPFTREMEDRLGLSREQLDKIHAILDASRDKADAIRRELRPRLEAHLEETRTEIAGVLDPEQRKRFEAMVEENKARADRFFLDGPPPPPPFGGPPPPPPPR